MSCILHRDAVMTIHLRHPALWLLGMLLVTASVIGLSRAYQRGIDVKKVELRTAIPSAELVDKQLNRRVETLLRTMPLEEKIGQLVQYTGGVATGPGTGRQDYESMRARGSVGSIFIVVGAKGKKS